MAVAEHLMLQKRWEEAPPYAEKAAESYAEWALTCPADCLAGLKRYDEGEKYMQACADRYPTGAFSWYFWCQRTGQGDLAAARSRIRKLRAGRKAAFVDHNEQTFLIMEGEQEEALRQCQKSLLARPHPTFGLTAATLADELKQPKNRDVALELVVEAGKKEGEYGKFAAQLATLFQGALADPAKLEALPKQVDAVLAGIPRPRDRSHFSYYAGKFLVLRGKSDEGWALLKQSAELPFTEAVPTLATVELRRHEEEEKKK